MGQAKQDGGEPARLGDCIGGGFVGRCDGRRRALPRDCSEREPCTAYRRRGQETGRDSAQEANDARNESDANAARANAARAEADRSAAEAKAVVAFVVDDVLGAASPSKTRGKSVTVLEALANADRSLEGQVSQGAPVEASIRQALGGSTPSWASTRRPKGMLPGSHHPGEGSGSGTPGHTRRDVRGRLERLLSRQTGQA